MVKIKMKLVFLCILLFVLALVLISCSTLNVEKSPYKVVETYGNIEIRRYEPQIIAETVVEDNFENAGNKAFGVLFNYISGNNKKSEKIAMTTPVNQQGDGEKIAMTAPVNQQQTEGKYVVSFIMPVKYNMDTLPKPLNEKVIVRRIPARKMAVVKYSGSWSKQSYVAHKTLLEEFLKEEGLKARDDFIWSRYNSPMTPWFLRRNEVMVEID